jgi:hypothetical protein
VAPDASCALAEACALQWRGARGVSYLRSVVLTFARLLSCFWTGCKTGGTPFIASFDTIKPGKNVIGLPLAS